MLHQHAVTNYLFRPRFFRRTVERCVHLGLYPIIAVDKAYVVAAGKLNSEISYRPDAAVGLVDHPNFGREPGL